MPTPDLDTVNAIRDAKSAVEAIRILRKHTEGLREEEVAEAIENLKRVKQPDNGLPLFFIFQDILSYAPDGEIATLAKQGLEALTPPTN